MSAMVVCGTAALELQYTVCEIPWQEKLFSGFLRYSLLPLFVYIKSPYRGWLSGSILILQYMGLR